MSNPVTPDQPYNSQPGASVPSAGSAPVYASYQGGSTQQNTYGTTQGYPTAQSGPVSGGQMATSQTASSGGSVFANIFDTSRAFAQKYGNAVFLLGAFAYLGIWLFAVIEKILMVSGPFAGGDAVVTLISLLLPGLAKACVDLFILRLIIEIAANLGKDRN